MILTDHQNIKENFKTYMPCICSYTGILFMANQVLLAKESAMLETNISAYTDFERYRYKTADNNWLKRHGYPMRRNCGRKKRS